MSTHEKATVEVPVDAALAIVNLLRQGLGQVRNTMMDSVVSNQIEPAVEAGESKATVFLTGYDVACLRRYEEQADELIDQLMEVAR